MRILKNANLPFVRIRYIAYAISAALLIMALVGLIIRGLNWSTDFTGGLTAQVNLKPAQAGTPQLNIDKLRKVINDNGFKEAEIQYVGDPQDAVFQIKLKGDSEEETQTQLGKILTTQLSDYTAGRDMSEIFSEVNKVGPKAGTEMRTNAIIAVLIALLLIIIYIWIRFEFTFGLMAIVALFHDVLCIVGIFAITGKEITMQIVAALLTIVGYSINDTIVVFDRIREDLKIYRKDPIPVVFNRAINTTLSRTVITAGTTLLTALALYFFGGPVIHDFAFAITLGLIFGTYSSIFVASNLVIDTYKFTHKEKQSIQHLTKKK
ncbi:MAG TPA: protein translocase subunit SecF [Candidatus Syntrophosphaera sp.]|nr:protein translocase subunit SecF [Candidatus Syntrophosphaera sp.]